MSPHDKAWKAHQHREAGLYHDACWHQIDNMSPSDRKDCGIGEEAADHHEKMSARHEKAAKKIDGKEPYHVPMTKEILKGVIKHHIKENIKDKGAQKDALKFAEKGHYSGEHQENHPHDDFFKPKKPKSDKIEKTEDSNVEILAKAESNGHLVKYIKYKK
jgi:hypothetical protein